MNLTLDNPLQRRIDDRLWGRYVDIPLACPGNRVRYNSGNAADGEFIHSLNLVDVRSTWVETGAVLGKGAAGIQRMVEELRAALPFALRGLDSDNGSEFINGTLYDYCQAHEIQFTRRRPYKKDDNAHVEQKNWTHVRKLLG